MNIIDVQDLTKYYGKSRGIEGLSFNVNEGEIFGFIGPNGAGKSTTIRLLLSLIFPTSGQAMIFGKDVTLFGPEIRQKIGYLPSEVFYYDDMNVRDLLNYSASFYPGDHRGRIAYLADIMELEMNRKIRDLSYGNKKKVGIVQGLLHNPPLLFLDEPTSGLDPLMQRKFFDLIREENKKGVTVFFSSHFLGEVQRLCDRVGIIREGTMVEVSDIHTLQKNNYKKIRFISEGAQVDPTLPGLSNLQQEGDWTQFFYSGDINLVLDRLASVKLEDLSIEEPTLEEIFMHYYE
ncbi:MAG: ABC transporter ATP-binding protein [Anaerolineaceae bacterium]